MKSNIKLLLFLAALILIYITIVYNTSSKNNSAEPPDNQVEKTPTHQKKKIKPLNIRRINTSLVNAKATERNDALREFLIAKQVFDGSRPIEISDIKTLTFKELTDLELITVSYIPNLLELNIAGTEVSNLDCLVNLVNLKHLNIAKTQVENIEALKQMDLKTLILSNTHILDHDVLGAMKSLEYLDISNSNVSDISSFKNLASLVHLNISNTPVSDLSPIESLTHLKKVNYSGSGVIINSSNAELILRTR
jgi:hypothetical protein